MLKIRRSQAQDEFDRSTKEPPEYKKYGSGLWAPLRGDLGEFVLQEPQETRQERAGQKGMDVFRSGIPRGRSFREVVKSGPLARRGMEISAVGKPRELDEMNRDFGQYLVDYLEIQEAKYSTDKEGG